MFYSNIDVSSILPTHLQDVIQSENKVIEKCGICHEELDVENCVPVNQITTKQNTVKLNCSHMFHYECLKEASISNKESPPRECALCRKWFQPLPIPQDDIYLPKFHIKKKESSHSESSFKLKLQKVEWASITYGEKLYISKNVSKRPYPTGTYVKQSKQQATLKLETGLLARYSKSNLFNILSDNTST